MTNSACQNGRDGVEKNVSFCIEEKGSKLQARQSKARKGEQARARNNNKRVYIDIYTKLYWGGYGSVAAHPHPGR